MDALHKAQVGAITAGAASPAIITGGQTDLTVDTSNAAPSLSDALNMTASASGIGYRSSTSGSLAATSSGSFTMPNAFNSSSLTPGSYTGMLTVTGTNSTLTGAALNSGGTTSVTVSVLDHAAAAFGDSSAVLNLSFGTVQHGAHAVQFQIQNPPAAYRAALDLDSVTELSDPSGLFSTDAMLFSDLAPGTVSGSFDLLLNDTSQDGQFSGEYEFNLSDEKDLSGHAGGQTLTLYATATVVPEATTIALLAASGICLAALARRQKGRR